MLLKKNLIAIFFFNFFLLFFSIDAFSAKYSQNDYSQDSYIFLNEKNIPSHIAIIMDGNRRWAKENKVSLYEGYLKGFEALFDIIKTSIDLKIKILTVYVFSTENWDRSKEEIDILKDVFEYVCKNYQKTLQELGVKLKTIGNISEFSKYISDLVSEIKKETENSKNLDLVVAINYGSRDEIKRAFLKLIDDVENNKIKKDEITEDTISNYLDTKDIKDPDLIIRTAKEARLSNFLLWQGSYSEIYIADMYWPDFTKTDFLLSILDFQKRKRKKGI